MSSKTLPAIRRSTGNKHNESKYRAYWELGRLGPDMSDPERLQQKANKARIKDFSERVWEINKSLKQRQTTNSFQTEEGPTSKRSRALLYSKSIRRPTLKGENETSNAKAAQENKIFAELERLEKEHEEHKKRIEQIAGEMSRRGI
eukprot:g3576.t1